MTPVTSLGVFHIRDQVYAAPVIGLAIQRRADVPGRPFKQAHAEPPSSPLTASVTDERGRSRSAGHIVLGPAEAWPKAGSEV